MSAKQYEEGAGITLPQKNAALMSADEVPQFRLREGNDGNPVWHPSNKRMLRGAFSPTGTKVLVSNGYERPDSQLITLPDGGLILAYLENAPENGARERTTLKVATFYNGHWSDPVTVQEDGTADFQPSICIAGDKVMIAWVSSEPDAHKTDNAVDYLKYLDVYTAMIDPSTLEVSETARMSIEDTPYYDYDPVCVYDDATGDRMVYYTKADTKGTVENIINTYMNDSAIIYRIYDADSQQWLETYFDEELDPEDWGAMAPWKGQRFLASPIEGISDNPVIADFTASTYNGLAVYAYTIDPDGSNDTDYDKELFVQVYDFTTHKTHKPIRITNDKFSDALPQIIRTGSGEEASTRLFWYHDGKKVQYINLSNLVHEGIENDGSIKAEYGSAAQQRNLSSRYG